MARALISTLKKSRSFQSLSAIETNEFGAEMEAVERQSLQDLKIDPGQKSELLKKRCSTKLEIKETLLMVKPDERCEISIHEAQSQKWARDVRSDLSGRASPHSTDPLSCNTYVI